MTILPFCELKLSLGGIRRNSKFLTPKSTTADHCAPFNGLKIGRVVHACVCMMGVGYIDREFGYIRVVYVVKLVRRDFSKKPQNLATQLDAREGIA